MVAPDVQVEPEFHLQTCGAPSNRTVTPMNDRFACGSMVLLFIFFTNMWLCEPHVREKG